MVMPQQQQRWRWHDCSRLGIQSAAIVWQNIGRILQEINAGCGSSACLNRTGFGVSIYV
jgi:hypothetical protein